MASNFVQPGDVLPLIAPYDVVAGAGFLIGSLFAVAQNTAASGAAVEGGTRGVVDLKKTSAQAWATVGLLIYWDNTAKECTTTSSGNKLIGVNVATAANPSGLGRVRLNGVYTS